MEGDKRWPDDLPNARVEMQRAEPAGAGFEGSASAPNHRRSTGGTKGFCFASRCSQVALDCPLELGHRSQAAERSGRGLFVERALGRPFRAALVC